MLSPICDDVRMLLGVIATLSGMVFAAMTSVLRDEIRNLSRRLFHWPPQEATEGIALPVGRMRRSVGWLLLVVSFLAVIVLGPYAAAVPSKTCVKLVISELVCHPPDGAETQVTGEYVRLQNLGSGKINLNHWTLCDYRNYHCYEFQDVTLPGRASLTLWTKSGQADKTDLYFGSDWPIWDNGKDTAYLYDEKDQLIYQLPCPDE